MYFLSVCCYFKSLKAAKSLLIHIFKFALSLGWRYMFCNFAAHTFTPLYVPAQAHVVGISIRDWVASISGEASKLISLSAARELYGCLAFTAS